MTGLTPDIKAGQLAETHNSLPMMVNTSLLIHLIGTHGRLYAFFTTSGGINTSA
ncbi:hypothetical protein ACFL17_02110 [Pseudomonadota bacterium]